MSRRMKQEQLKKLPLKKMLVSKFFLSPLSNDVFNLLFDYEAVFIRWFFNQLYKPIAEETTWRISDDSSLLDVGCGPGFLLFEIHKLNEKAQLTGVDISRSMIRKAKKKLRKLGYENIDFFVNRTDKLPFKDDTFSHAISTFSFHLWSKPVLMLNEIYRVLMDGGEFIFYDFNGDDAFEKENLQYIEDCVKDAPWLVRKIIIEDARWDYTMFGIYDIREIEGIIKNSLFKTGEIKTRAIGDSSDDFLIETRLRK